MCIQSRAASYMCIQMEDAQILVATQQKSLNIVLNIGRSFGVLLFTFCLCAFASHRVCVAAAIIIIVIIHSFISGEQASSTTVQYYYLTK